MPLLSPFSNSRGTLRTRSALILQLSQGGTEALSECVADESPSCTHEDNRTALRFIKGALGGRARPPTPKEFLESCDDLRGNQMAKAAVEMLLWDYLAKAAGEPLDELLGDSRGYAEAGIALGLEGKGEVREHITRALERGYKRIKVKIDRVGAYETLKGVRNAFPEIRLSADANGCFKLRGDLRALRRIDRFELEYLEQPLGYDALTDHSRLAKEVSTPICLDESVTSLDRAEQVLDMGAAKVINIKPGRVGGMSVAMEVARMARERGAHAWVGGMLETGIGRAFNVALAAQPEIDYPGDTSPNERYFERDLAKNPFIMRLGRVRPNRGPGIGVVLDRDFLAEVTFKSWKIF